MVTYARRPRRRVRSQRVGANLSRREIYWVRNYFDTTLTTSATKGAHNLLASKATADPNYTAALRSGVAEPMITDDNVILEEGSTIDRVRMKILFENPGTAADWATIGIVKAYNPDFLGSSGTLPSPFQHANSGDWMAWEIIHAGAVAAFDGVTNLSMHEFDVRSKRRISEFGQTLYVVYELAANARCQIWTSTLVRNP